MGKMPELPSRAHPWLRHWAKPLVERFEYLIGREVRKAYGMERQAAAESVARHGVDTVPVVQPVVDVWRT